MRMSPGPSKKKSTAAQRFKKLFDLYMDESAPPGERENAKRKADAWLKQHQKSWRDASSILAQAAADDAAAAPPPPSSDPRDDTAHPFDASEFSPVGVVTGIVSKYVKMPSDHALIIFALWICFTHVYEQFGIAPRVALVSDEPDSGKTTAKNVAKRLVRRPNPESFGTAAAISEFIDEGPCTILLDELDQIDKEGRRRLQLIWNLGHERGAKYAMVIGGRLLEIEDMRLVVKFGEKKRYSDQECQAIYQELVEAGLDDERETIRRQRSLNCAGRKWAWAWTKHR
jgi:hypothetical protein